MTRLHAFGIYSLLFFCLFSLAACSPYEKILKSSDINLKLKAANDYYDKKKWSKANELYRSLIPVVKGTRNYEPLYYRYAYTFYYMKDYLEASYHFKNFTDFFPASKDGEECKYMNAVCLYKLAPKSSLDQTNTIKAMEALQDYVNMYPASKRVTEANSYLDEARKRLEEKEAGSARLYYNIGQYKAAAYSYRTVLQQYPESPNSDYYQYMVVKCLYFYARKSVESKQTERFADVQNAFRELKETYPRSTFINDAEHYANLAQATVKNP